MTGEGTIAWNVQDHIATPERQLGYLDAALDDGNPHLIAAVLADIAKARGIEPAGEDPPLSSLLAVLRSLGFELRIVTSRGGEQAA